MNVTTVAEIVDQARRLETLAAGFCERLAGQTADEGVERLARHLGRHCRRLSEALGEVSREECERLCSVPVPYGPQRVDFRHLEHMELPPDATPDQMLDAAMRMDEGLTGLFRQVLRQQVVGEVRELFEALVRWEEADEAELRKLRALGCMA